MKYKNFSVNQKNAGDHIHVNRKFEVTTDFDFLEFMKEVNRVCTVYRLEDFFEMESCVSNNEYILFAFTSGHRNMYKWSSDSNIEEVDKFMRSLLLLLELKINRR